MSSNANVTATMYTLAMPASTLLPNLIVNNDALSTGDGGNPTVSPNKNTTTTSTNTMTTSIDMASNHIYILINSATFYEPRYDPVP